MCVLQENLLFPTVILGSVFSDTVVFNRDNVIDDTAVSLRQHTVVDAPDGHEFSTVRITVSEIQTGQKLANFTHPTCIWRLFKGHSIGISPKLWWFRSLVVRASDLQLNDHEIEPAEPSVGWY